MIKVGINGLGRIGRAILRNNLRTSAFEVAAINDINPDPDNIAYTLNYDSIYGRLPIEFKHEKHTLLASNGSAITLHNEHSINEVDWQRDNIDFVIDASGVYQNVLDSRKLIDLGKVKKVFVTHSPNNVDFTLVLGANEHLLDISRHHVIASSICDATALAPVIRVIIEDFGLDSGLVTTIHPWLSYQNLMDGPASSWSVPGTIYHHYALGRSAIGNLIPKPTSAIQATCQVLQHLNLSEDMIGSFSYRPPTAIVGTADLSLFLSREISREEIVERFQHYESQQHWNIIHNNFSPLVSLDFQGSEYSATIDHRWTNVIKSRLLKLVLWYDNEAGYASKVIDQVNLVASQMKLA
ncbi:aldehyde dehydrogenase [Cyanobium sp. ATX 6A2]|uniref:glyceraldehyde 3-phosphate dehydrogenase NAD-binding domain-containing protein n=1 Tax=Cyanobium sp. ATX 6A2 TaxID=2823700 RepID=UPI0020CC705D|nr:glyceraldehyde 3-phosphate dehydrogenase NAD-binding domain-containing protein [Cyanobium sp. ATX 6A2]MCP9889244.1 aldehyde dehydrogenase [Cyanobium sp. ATX 6A2]